MNALTQARNTSSSPSATARRERTFGTGYGRSSGYAAAPGYARSPAMPMFRCT